MKEIKRTYTRKADLPAHMRPNPNGKKSTNPGWSIPEHLRNMINGIVEKRNARLPAYQPKWTPSAVVAEILSDWVEPNP